MKNGKNSLRLILILNYEVYLKTYISQMHFEGVTTVTILGSENGFLTPVIQVTDNPEMWTLLLHGNYI